MGAFFVGPYITHLVRHMVTLQWIDRMCVIGGVTPITLEILRLMRMVYRVTTAGEVEYHITLSEDLPDTATAAPPLLLPPYHTFPHHLNHHLLLLAWSSIPPLSSSGYKG